MDTSATRGLGFINVDDTDHDGDAIDICRQLEARMTTPNEMYQLAFRLFQFAGKEAEIPRVVVFGQQSMGKTALLDYIMGGPIGYSSSSIGTKKPIVIQLRPASDGVLRSFFNGKEELLDQIPVLMAEAMENLGGNISSSELNVRLEVPEVCHSVFVDLPGIQDDSKRGSEFTRKVVRDYVQNNPNDLYLLVKKSSDDPANWPYTLKDFILGQQPGGLGLSAPQTIVVGTRAVEFLRNERSDVQTVGELLERVSMRKISDRNGQEMPMFLLELFSLSVEDKGENGFYARREEMRKQIVKGKSDIAVLLSEYSSDGTSSSSVDMLAKVFDHMEFRATMTKTFNKLLRRQFKELGMRIEEQVRKLRHETSLMEGKLRNKTAMTVRETIRLLIRELIGIVTELVRGDRTLMRQGERGDAFLEQFGGSLEDNLREGQELAMKLFPPDSYPSDFLDSVLATESRLLHLEASRKVDKIKIRNVTLVQEAIVSGLDIETPLPLVHPYLLPGQWAMKKLEREEGYMLCFLHKFEAGGSPTSRAEPVDENDRPRAADGIDYYRLKCDATFYYETETKGTFAEQRRTGNILQNLSTLIPISVVAEEISMMTPEELGELEVFRWSVRRDRWIAAERCTILNYECGPPAGVGGSRNHQDRGRCVWPHGTKDNTAFTGIATTVIEGSRDEEITTLDCLYVSASCIQLVQGKWTVSQRGAGLSPHSLIVGGQASSKLLNQLAWTYLGRWLKWHVAKLEPEWYLSKQMMLQSLRGVQKVVDKADWEPLVADLLQSNVRGGMVNLTRLSAAAGGVALRRVLRAALADLRHEIKRGSVDPKLELLAESDLFMDEVVAGLEDLIDVRVRQCSEEMRDSILGLTQAVHFEMIEDFFLGCRDFEEAFLPGVNLMDAVIQKVSKDITNRKRLLSVNDIFERASPNQVLDEELLYQQVQIQFWSVKTLLAAPLMSKIYMHFVADVKDRSTHMGLDVLANTSAETSLEREMQRRVLCFPHSEDIESSPASDKELIARYDLELGRDKIISKLSENKKQIEYMELLCRGTVAFNKRLESGMEINFLKGL